MDHHAGMRNVWSRDRSDCERVATHRHPTSSMMSLPEAAKSLGLAPSTLRHQIKNGKLAARKVSRDWYITSEEVERYRLEHRNGRAA